MATTYTDNFHLGKQENRPDKFDMSVITRNMEIIDAAMQEILDTIAEIDSKKVSKVEGKDLSDENYTADEKAKLASLEDYDDTELRKSLIEVIDSGAKNRLLPQTGSFSTHGASISVTDDEIVISGETDTASNIFWNLYANADKKINIPVGEWVASLDIQTDDIRFAVYADNVLVARGNWGEPLQFSISEGKTVSWMRIELKPETVYDETIRVMLCTVAEYAVSQKFVAYVPSNSDINQIITDLTARVAALEGGDSSGV